MLGDDQERVPSSAWKGQGGFSERIALKLIVLDGMSVEGRFFMLRVWHRAQHMVHH